MTQKQEPFTLATRADDAVLVARLRGEIDHTCAAEVGSELLEAAAALPPPELIVLDLAHVSFLSVAGVRIIHQVAAGWNRRGIRIRLVIAPDSVVARLADIVGFRVLPTYPTVEKALRPGA